MARKPTTRLTVECLETRDAPSVAQPILASIPAPKPILAIQAQVQTSAPTAVQMQTLSGLTKVQAGPATPLLPVHVADAIGISFNAGIAGLRRNHNQTLVQIGARKRGRKS